jgi:hypothetical protein
MPQMIYHGDPSREHRFWVYPKHKSLQNPQWDTYNPHDLCDNFTILNGFTDTKMYQCNGHPKYVIIIRVTQVLFYRRILNNSFVLVYGLVVLEVSAFNN